MMKNNKMVTYVDTVPNEMKQTPEGEENLYL